MAGLLTGSRIYINMDIVKTTIDIPDGLYRQAKIRAIQTGLTLRELVLDGLKSSLKQSIPLPDAKPTRRKVRNGVPLLAPGNRRIVTNAEINHLRDELGI